MTDASSYLQAFRPRLRQPSAADLCEAVPAMTAEQTNEQVMEAFARHRELVSLPVVEGTRPIGLINRSIFLSQMSKPFHKELYDRKSCIAFMDKEPLVVDAAMGIDELTVRTVEAGEKALTDGFIITRGGAFAGVGHGLQLMRVVADMQAARHRQIMHSIEYASVIQQSMLRTSRQALAQSGLDADLVWEPRDVVGGDFYQFGTLADGWFATVADCTGHGVPGAFMTLIASITLSQAVARHGPRHPERLLAEVNVRIKDMLGQTDDAAAVPHGASAAPHGDHASNDGLDGACLWFHAPSCQLHVAGAKTSLFVLHPGQTGVEMVDGERQGVGYRDSPADFEWTPRTVQLQPGSLVFATTDGLVDQIGGPKAIAFGKRRIRELLLAHRELPAAGISQALLGELAAWQGEHHRRDDLTFFCFRVQEHS